MGPLAIFPCSSGGGNPTGCHPLSYPSRQHCFQEQPSRAGGHRTGDLGWSPPPRPRLSRHLTVPGHHQPALPELPPHATCLGQHGSYLQLLRRLLFLTEKLLWSGMTHLAPPWVRPLGSPPAASAPADPHHCCRPRCGRRAPSGSGRGCGGSYPHPGPWRGEHLLCGPTARFSSHHCIGRLGVAAAPSRCWHRGLTPAATGLDRQPRRRGGT